MAISRLYLIEVKDAETGVSEFVTTVDWTANQKLQEGEVQVSDMVLLGREPINRLYPDQRMDVPSRA
jgi:hypothetical protein